MKRLQVLIDETEYEHFLLFAKQNGLTLAEWVRQALRQKEREQPIGVRDEKLARVRAAAGHSFPAGDIDTMLDEISRGYGDLPPA